MPKRPMPRERKSQFISISFFEALKWIGTGFLLFSGFFTPLPFAGLFGIIGAMVWWLFCEGVLVFFRIYEKLCDIETVLIEQGRQASLGRAASPEAPEQAPQAIAEAESAKEEEAAPRPEEKEKYWGPPKS